MDELAGRLAAEIESTRAEREDSRQTESYIRGIKRAMVLAVGTDRARIVLAEYGEAE